jgi:hypothetical protein
MKAICKAVRVLTIGVMGLALTTGSAFAACGAAALNGSWHFFAMQNSTPGIKTVSKAVKSSTDTNINIRVFNGIPNNGTATAIKCTLTVTGATATGANFTGTCGSQNVIKDDNGDGVSVSGSLSLNSCTITSGTLTVQDDPKVVTFLGGHFNGTMGTGIGKQDHQQAAFNLFNHVFLWTMIKN